MRHQSAGRKLGRTTSHRWALFRNMMESLVEHERIETTLHKAKELRSFADHLITLGKQDTLSARRQAAQYLRSKGMVTKLFVDLAPRFKERAGGYTRVLKLGFRLGDSAAMALIEYIPGEGQAATERQGGKKKAVAKKKAKAEAAPKKEKAPKPEKKEKTEKKTAVKKAAAPKKKAAKKKQG